MDKKDLKCFESDGNTHKRDYLQEIYRIGDDCGDADADSVVRWCEICGAVVVDKEYDGRLVDYEVPMKFPNTIFSKD